MRQPFCRLVWLALFAAPIPLLAQGAAFTYQGRLVDAGQPANGSYDLRFALTDAAAGGNHVGTLLTNAPVVVSNGYFMVVLDFSGAPFDGAARWLEIGVRTNGSSDPYTVLSPRQAITATPYATFASTAATATVAASLALGATIGGNGAGITNLNGANIAPGTISSNALDAATQAQLALAGTGSPLDAIAPEGRYRMQEPIYTVNLWLQGTPGGQFLTNVARAFSEWGLTNAGLLWLCLDDGWQGPDGPQSTNYHDANHFLTVRTNEWPDGVKPVADYLHGLGFKLGLYLNSGSIPPNGYGYNNYPEQEAQSLCNWGVDYIKLDGASMDYLRRFAAAADSNYVAQGRQPMYIQVHIEPPDPVIPWANGWTNAESRQLCDSIFTGGDPVITFAGALAWYARVLGTYTGPYPQTYTSFAPSAPELAFWVRTNLYSTGNTNARGMKTLMGITALAATEMQTYSYAATGNVLSYPGADYITALTNADVLAVFRDAGRVQGRPLRITSTNHIWMKPLGSSRGPEYAVLIANPTTTTTQPWYFSLTNLPTIGRIARAKELWSGQEQLVSGGLWVTNYPCESKLFRLTPYTTRAAEILGQWNPNTIGTNTPSAGQVLKFDGTNMYWADP